MEWCLKGCIEGGHPLYGGPHVSPQSYNYWLQIITQHLRIRMQDLAARDRQVLSSPGHSHQTGLPLFYLVPFFFRLATLLFHSMQGSSSCIPSSQCHVSLCMTQTERSAMEVPRLLVPLNPVRQLQVQPCQSPADAFLLLSLGSLSTCRV